MPWLPEVGGAPNYGGVVTLNLWPGEERDNVIDMGGLGCNVEMDPLGPEYLCRGGACPQPAPLPGTPTPCR